MMDNYTVFYDIGREDLDAVPMGSTARIHEEWIKAAALHEVTESNVETPNSEQKGRL